MPPETVFATRLAMFGLVGLMAMMMVNLGLDNSSSDDDDEFSNSGNPEGDGADDGHTMVPISSLLDDYGDPMIDDPESESATVIQIDDFGNTVTPTEATEFDEMSEGESDDGLVYDDFGTLVDEEEDEFDAEFDDDFDEDEFDDEELAELEALLAEAAAADDSLLDGDGAEDALLEDGAEVASSEEGLTDDTSLVGEDDSASDATEDDSTDPAFAALGIEDGFETDDDTADDEDLEYDTFAGSGLMAAPIPAFDTSGTLLLGEDDIVFPGVLPSDSDAEDYIGGTWVGPHSPAEIDDFSSTDDKLVVLYDPSDDAALDLAITDSTEGDLLVSLGGQTIAKLTGDMSDFSMDNVSLVAM